VSGRPTKYRTAAMRKRCTIQQPTETQDSFGQPVVTWTDFMANEPCQFVPTGGTENMRGRQLEATVAGIFRVRYRVGYTTKMKVVYENHSYGIKYINPVEGLERFIELMVASND